jgi:hypothetical protein
VAWRGPGPGPSHTISFWSGRQGPPPHPPPKSVERQTYVTHHSQHLPTRGVWMVAKGAAQQRESTHTNAQPLTNTPALFLLVWFGGGGHLGFQTHALPGQSTAPTTSYAHKCYHAILNTHFPLQNAISDGPLLPLALRPHAPQNLGDPKFHGLGGLQHTHERFTCATTACPHGHACRAVPNTWFSHLFTAGPRRTLATPNSQLARPLGKSRTAGTAHEDGARTPNPRRGVCTHTLCNVPAPQLRPLLCPWPTRCGRARNPPPPPVQTKPELRRVRPSRGAGGRAHSRGLVPHGA